MHLYELLIPISRPIALVVSIVFFFQAEDGIRLTSVTGVQTCALPICRTDIFEYAGVFKDYLGIARLEDTYALLDKYQIRSILLPPDYPVCYVLEHRPEWKIAYKDSDRKSVV